jgi:hypothetical protein
LPADYSAYQQREQDIVAKDAENVGPQHVGTGPLFGDDDVDIRIACACGRRSEGPQALQLGDGPEGLDRDRAGRV